MTKYAFFLFLIISTMAFPMNHCAVNHSAYAIDPALIQRVTKKVVTNRRRSREIYCADLSTKQQLMAERITTESTTEFYCDLTASSGAFFHCMPVDNKHFALLEAKYREMQLHG